MAVTVVVLIAVLLIAGILAFGSMKKDTRIADDLRARNPEPVLVPYLAPVPVVEEPKAVSPAVMVRQASFGRIFWAVVCAQLFVGLVGWVLLMAAGVLH